MAKYACSHMRPSWTECNSFEQARQIVERSQRRQLFSNSPIRESKQGDDPHIEDLGKNSLFWVVRGGNYPGVYSYSEVATEAAAEQTECCLRNSFNFCSRQHVAQQTALEAKPALISDNW
jgi:hypothetical protein